jgi:F420-dependent methylenetetrahydromethanopterin dehydrogenase
MIDHVLTISSVVLAFIAVARSFMLADTKKKEAAVTAKHELGKRYAQMAWAYARSHVEAGDPVKLQKHAEDAFILADTAVDGKRDFTDSQAAVYLNAHK